jgi:hypothetical protein
MHLIRPLFGLYAAAECSNEQFADALLATCPELTEFWLTPRHIQQAWRHLRESE